MSMALKLEERLKKELPNLRLLHEEPLARHTSFAIGGPAELMALPQSVTELCILCRGAWEMGIRPVILGCGTNVLAPDEGVRGLVIKTREGLDAISDLEDGLLEAQAGAALSRLAQFAAGQNLAGLEFAWGIPGSVGGGLMMNAGAYGGEIGDLAVCTTVLTKDGEIKMLEGGNQGFSYRHSAFSEMDCVILSGRFQLVPGHPDEIQDKMREYSRRRKESQPLEYPSAGSTFKRPEGRYAAALIEQAGLKGARIGGAEVSEKHAGFIVNKGGATYNDVLALVGYVQNRVFETSGVRLELEVQILK